MIIIYDNRNEVKLISIEYFVDAHGNCLARDFIDSLDLKMRVKVFGRLELLEEYGPLLGMPFSRYLEDGIYELRTVQGNNATQMLYFFAGNNQVILTHGFTKKSQKTPKREIDKAKRLRDKWKELNEFI